MSKSPNNQNAPWLTTMAEHQGRRLALRVRPDVDTSSNRGSYPQLAVISHELSSVTADGMPEASYNDSLADFDREIHELFECEGEGLLVLVETFAGKRNYYAYVADRAPVRSRVDNLRTRFPQHRLKFRSGLD